jgi:hypothetical protein
MLAYETIVPVPPKCLKQKPYPFSGPIVADEEDHRVIITSQGEKVYYRYKRLMQQTDDDPSVYFQVTIRARTEAALHSVIGKNSIPRPSSCNQYTTSIGNILVYNLLLDTGDESQKSLSEMILGQWYRYDPDGMCIDRNRPPLTTLVPPEKNLENFRITTTNMDEQSHHGKNINKVNNKVNNKNKYNNNDQRLLHLRSAKAFEAGEVLGVYAWFTTMESSLLLEAKGNLAIMQANKKPPPSSASHVAIPLGKNFWLDNSDDSINPYKKYLLAEASPLSSVLALARCAVNGRDNNCAPAVYIRKQSHVLQPDVAVVIEAVEHIAVGEEILLPSPKLPMLSTDQISISVGDNNNHNNNKITTNDIGKKWRSRCLRFLHNDDRMCHIILTYRLHNFTHNFTEATVEAVILTVVRMLMNLIPDMMGNRSSVAATPSRPDLSSVKKLAPYLMEAFEQMGHGPTGLKTTDLLCFTAAVITAIKLFSSGWTRIRTQVTPEQAYDQWYKTHLLGKQTRSPYSLTRDASERILEKFRTTLCRVYADVVAGSLADSSDIQAILDKVDGNEKIKFHKQALLDQIVRALNTHIMGKEQPDYATSYAYQKQQNRRDVASKAFFAKYEMWKKRVAREDAASRKFQYATNAMTGGGDEHREKKQKRVSWDSSTTVNDNNTEQVNKENSQNMGTTTYKGKGRETRKKTNDKKQKRKRKSQKMYSLDNNNNN